MTASQRGITYAARRLVNSVGGDPRSAAPDTLDRWASRTSPEEVAAVRAWLDQANDDEIRAVIEDAERHPH